MDTDTANDTAERPKKTHRERKRCNVFNPVTLCKCRQLRWRNTPYCRYHLERAIQKGA